VFTDVQKMGYGSRAIDLLLAYFQGQLTVETLHPALGVFGGEGKGAPSEDHGDASGGAADLQGEEIKPKAKLPPLLTPIAERPAELLHWFGTSFGLTTPLLTFWSRKGFKVCYLRQTRNELTGEHSAICLRELEPIPALSASRSKGKALMDSGPAEGWLGAFVKDYRRRLISLMSYSFSTMEAPLAITLLDPDRKLTSSSTSAVADADDVTPKPSAARGAPTGADAAALGEAVFRPVTAQELLSVHLSHHDMQRLELYSRNMVDHHMILDALPILTSLLFQGRMPEIHLSYLQVAIVLATGLQHRDVDSIAAELNLPANQVLAFFNKTVRKITAYLRSLIETDAALTLPSADQVNRIEKSVQGMHALAESLDQDQRADEVDFVTKQQQRELIMGHKDLAKHAVKADLAQLEKALAQGVKKQLAVPKIISVPKGSTPAAVLPALSADDLAGDESDAAADEQASGEKKAKKDKKDKRRREEPEESAAAVTPAKPQQQQQKGTSQTEKKKDKSAKKAKRESL
jgi:N-acetyltransferase 10